MKTKITYSIFLTFLLLTVNILTLKAQQVVSKINYQAVLRDVDGNAIDNQAVSIKFEILPATGSAVYEETKALTTSDFGVINTTFGPLGNADGGSGYGNLNLLDWAANGYRLKASVTSPNTADLGTQSFTVVPYAFHAKTSDTAAYALQSNVSAPILTINGQTLGIQGSNTVTLPAEVDGSVTNELQDLSVSGNVVSLSQSNSTLTITIAGNELKINNTTVATLPDLTPSGTIVAFGGTVAPAGWALCNGQTLSRATDIALYNVIGVNYGVGDGSSTFNLPDFRGKFLRGVDNAQGNDPDVTGRTNNGAGLKDAPGSTQAGATKFPNAPFVTNTSGNHSHAPACGGGFLQGNDSCGGGAVAATGSQIGIKVQNNTGSSGDHSHTISGGDSETRPTNVYVNYIIKK